MPPYVLNVMVYVRYIPDTSTLQLTFPAFETWILNRFNEAVNRRQTDNMLNICHQIYVCGNDFIFNNNLYYYYFYYYLLLTKS